MKHGSLFSGIGGFDLAAEWMGWTNVFHCEWMEFPRKVLDYHFPNADSHIDICKTDFKKYANKIDILTGGFPCQPFSLAGKRKGTDDERYLWGEMLRAIQEIKPKFVIAENVFGITNIDGGLVFQQVCLDLENEGYEVQPFIIPAAAKDAPHRRDRCWFIAYANGNDGRSTNRESGCEESKTNGEGEQPIHSRIGTTSNEGIAADTKSNGSSIGKLGESQTKQQVQTGSDIDGFESLGNVTNTKCCRGIQGSKNLQPKKSNGFQFIRNGRKRNASNTNGNGLNQCNSNDEINTSQRRFNALNDIKQISIDTKCIGRTEIRNDNGQFKTPQQSECREQQFSGTDSTQSWWRNFPSQSPVCGGNDGLPTQLDGITFPKWRAESIKGYGNAIVPQIAYQLFEIIQELNENN
jgi:DNA (cytosine-5)-methyltransferase 1